MNITHKDASIVSTDVSDDAPYGSFTAILSAPTKDRDGETLYADGWKQPLPDRIPMDIDHSMSVAGTVGSAHPYIDTASGNLMVDATFASTPLAQEVRTLVNEKHINTLSVAFMTEKTTKDGVSETKRELLNFAVCAIPSNREALILASKTAPAAVKAGARNAKADAEMIQTVHDTAQALGATCPAGDAAVAKVLAEKASRKAIVGSLEAAQARLADALEDAYPNMWPCLRGTLPSGDGGTVVYDLTDPNSMDWERQSYTETYTDDGSVVTLAGDAKPVDIMEIVTPDADEEPDSQVYTASAVEARALLAGVDLTLLPEAVQKALGLLVPPPDSTDVKAARSAELAPTAKALGSTEAVTPADEDAEMQFRAAQFRAYRNLLAPERG